jgi:RNA polymerase sigma-70 factor (ECF subfamily)
MRDSSAVADLQAEYGARIQQLAFRYLKNREDAEEVAQDVLMKVYRKIGAFRGDSALSSWIYRITFNTAMSRLRTGRGQPDRRNAARTMDQAGNAIERRPAEVPDWSPLADEEVHRGELRHRLLRELGELPAIYRRPLILRDVRGLSTQEASTVLRVKTQTLKSRLHRGRLILRDRLADFANGLELRRAA